METSGRYLSAIDFPASEAPCIVGARGKRIVDICLATLGIVIFTPLMLACALAVFSDTGGKILFRHRRIGFRGRSFECLKFQSMVCNAEELLADYLATNAAARIEWATTQKLRNDPRITPFGRLLRKSSLDELPQLFNVLKGDMSLIGPRPVTMQELHKRGRRDAGAYLSCRPGITGLWQVLGRSCITYRKRIACDTYYAKNWSYLVDLKILLRTIPILFRFDDAC